MMIFDENKPIYLQIADNISDSILSGKWPQGSRIPSVREWGAEIGVNPNTVARSYDLLSQKGIISKQRGVGFFVADNAVELIRSSERSKFLKEELPSFLSRAESLGVDIYEILKDRLK